MVDLNRPLFIWSHPAYESVNESSEPTRGEQDIYIFRANMDSNRMRGVRYLFYDLGEEMLGAEEGVGLVDRSGPGLDAAVPGLEVPAANSALDSYPEVPVGAQASLGKHNLLHFDRTRNLDHLIVIKGPFQP